MDDETIKNLLALKKGIVEYIDKVTSMTAKLEEYLQLIDSMISKSSFSTADVGLKAEPPTSSSAPQASMTKPPERTFPYEIVLMNKQRNLNLATMIVDERTITIIPADHAVYDIKLGAFARFLTERTLGGYQQEDRHRVENGEIEWNDAFDFEVIAEDGILKKLVIKNYGSEERLKDIQRRVRWTLEKTYKEK